MKGAIELLKENWIWWTELLMVLGVALLLSYLTRLFLARIVFKKTRKERRELFIKITKIVQWPLMIWLIWFFFHIIIGALDDSHARVLMGSPLYQIFIISLFAWLFIAVTTIFQAFLLDSYSMSKADNIRERKLHTQVLYIKRITILIIAIVAISMILMSFDSVRKIGTGLLASAGVLGIIIGLAAQRSISNLLAGMEIAFTQPIRIDDVVVVENEWGKIEEITLTYVVVRIWDMRRLVLPINYFMDKPFQNWTRTTADIWGTVFFHVDYKMPIEPLREALTKILKSSPHWDKQLNVLQVTDATDRSLEVRCIVSAKDSGAAWDLRCEVREKLIGFIQENYPECLPKIRVEGEVNQTAT